MSVPIIIIYNIDSIIDITIIWGTPIMYTHNVHLLCAQKKW